MSDIRRWPFSLTHPLFLSRVAACFSRFAREGRRGREGGRERGRFSSVKDGTRLQLASLFTVSLSCLLLSPPPSSLSFSLSLFLSISLDCQQSFSL
jgi:hypothetical protein